WLKDLRGLIAELEQEWELSIGQPLSGGSSAYVAPVNTASGTAVIKIAMPSRHRPYDFEQEIDTLLRADGHGYVRVFNKPSQESPGFSRGEEWGVLRRGLG